MAKKPVVDDNEVAKNKRDIVRTIIKNNPSISTRDVAESLLHKGYAVPDHADKSEGGVKAWSTFTVWVSSNKRAVFGNASPSRTRGSSTQDLMADLELASTLAETAGGAEEAIKFLDVISRLPSIGEARKALEKFGQLQEAIGHDAAKKAVATLFGHRGGNG